MSLRFRSKLSEKAIRHALNSRGYFRRCARVKPPLTDEHKRLRMAWAKKHLYWTKEQWYPTLWSDEGWATGGIHTTIYVTRKEGEDLDPMCGRTCSMQVWMDDLGLFLSQ
jgi:Transposase.